MQFKQLLKHYARLGANWLLIADKLTFPPGKHFLYKCSCTNLYSLHMHCIYEQRCRKGHAKHKEDKYLNKCLTQRNQRAQKCHRNWHNNKGDQLQLEAQKQKQLRALVEALKELAHSCTCHTYLRHTQIHIHPASGAARSSTLIAIAYNMDALHSIVVVFILSFCCW